MELLTGSSKYIVNRPALDIEERVASLFQPDTLLAAQYFDNLRRKTVFEPEKRLMLAVLEDAVNCFQENVSAHSGKRERLFEEAEEWILETGGDWLFSFENICEVLELNPQYARQGLLRWKERKLMRHPSQAWEKRAMAG